MLETLKKPVNTHLYLFCEKRFIIDVLNDEKVLECIYNEIGYVFKKFKKIKTLVTKKIDIEMVELFYEALFSILGYIYQSTSNDKNIKEDKDVEEIEQDITLLENLLHIDRLIEGICKKEKITEILKDIQKDIQKDIENENYINNSNNDDVIMLGGDNEIVEDYYTEYIKMKSRYLDLKNEFL
jgi:secreted Zn-dependent insulinase-like peptidase